MRRKLMYVMSAIALAAVLMGSGCTTPSGTGGVEVTAPRTYGQSLMYGYETHATVNETATALLKAKVIDKEDAQRVLGITNMARSGLDSAMRTGCPDMEAYLKVPKDARGAEPACLANIPPDAVARLKLAVGAAEQALTFVNAFKR